MPRRQARSNLVTCDKCGLENGPARDGFASFCDVYAEKCAISAVDGTQELDCNALMGRARKALARRLRVLRSIRGWTQEDLADASGLHRTYVSLIERGECNVGIDNIERLAETFGVSLAELFGMTETVAPERARRKGRAN
jgi:ribosome-binding protein aMBF1 (putative translation factor)